MKIFHLIHSGNHTLFSAISVCLLNTISATWQRCYCPTMAHQSHTPLFVISQIPTPTVNRMDGLRHSCVAPEIVPVDSALQPYVDYSGPQAVCIKSEREVAVGDAQLEMALGEGKEACGSGDSEHHENRQRSVERFQRQWASSDEVYDRVRELARRHIGWILLIVAVVVITVIVQAASSGGQEKLLDRHSAESGESGFQASNITVHDGQG